MKMNEALAFNFRFSLLALCLLFFVPVSIAEEGGGWPVPTKKAEKPKMDPKPEMPEVTHKVYFDIEIEGDKSQSGRIVLGLFGTVAPKTVENFRGLCACNKGVGKLSGKPLCYKGSRIHRILPNFIIQGGDITHGNGTGGESIYGGHFEDETFEVKHNKKLLLSMANHGPNSNGSQFFINTAKVSWLDKKNVVFGMVLEGDDVIKTLDTLGSYSGKPTAEVIIKDSGVLKRNQKSK
mmetsp:Transcript_11990/g.25381  ORF Transcript_11990/g.25381 Transcript_11990/m.25381 type:complete len:236 (+) Transcript_11990:79-786(+)